LQAINENGITRNNNEKRDLILISSFMCVDILKIIKTQD